MSAVERAALAIHAVDVRYSATDGWSKSATDIAEALAAAGLLVTDTDRAVLDAAEAETAAEAEFEKWQRGPRQRAEAAHRELRSAQYTRRSAVRARREAQEVAEQDAYNQAIQWDPTNGGARREGGQT